MTDVIGEWADDRFKAAVERSKDPAKRPTLRAVFNGERTDPHRNGPGVRHLGQLVYELLGSVIGDDPWEVAVDPFEYPEDAERAWVSCIDCGQWVDARQVMQLTIQFGADGQAVQAIICAVCACVIDDVDAIQRNTRREGIATGGGTDEVGNREGGPCV
ncbi:hypothetical protein [Calidifontibacter terrae]